MKWMLITVLAIALLGLGVFYFIYTGGAPVKNAFAPGLESPGADAPAPETERPAATPGPTEAPTPEPTPEPTATPDASDPTVRVQQTLERMSLAEKIGQLVMFGFAGTEAPSSAFQQIMETYQVGNIVLYGPNIESGNEDGGFSQAKALTDTLNGLNQTGIPLLISIDIEGGSVVRFHWSPWPDSARTLGRNNDPAAAKEQFQRIGAALRGVGINMNLAPVLDVAEFPMDTFLTTRIISQNADIAGRIGAAVIEGLKESNCLSTAKHFPGHGGTTGDSHDTTPVVNKSLDEMLSYDLIPFAEGIEAGVDTVLVAHISYPELDAENIATQSEAIMTGLLRNELKFEGVIMSDDFRMKGLTSQVPVDEAAVNFINAGGDLILCGAVPEKQKAILEGLKTAVSEGRLTEARIDESVFRILMNKAKVTGWTLPEGAA